jgi:hypothetical protein
MRRVAIGLLLLALCLCLAGMASGCKFVSWDEGRNGPAIGASSPPCAGGVCPEPDRPSAYVRVGVARWTDAEGREHLSPVYARRGEDGVRGPTGPEGDKGQSGKDGQPGRELILIPDSPAVSDAAPRYDAKGGQYKRNVEGWSFLWGGDPFSGLDKLQPMQSSGERLPSWDARTGRLGETRGGTFLGGGLESATEAVRRGPVVLFVLGSLAMLAGIVLIVWAKRYGLGLAVAGGGGVLIATGALLETAPWLPWVALAAVVAVGVWWIIDAKSAKSAAAKLSETATALSAVVRGVEATDPESSDAVKAAIASAATATGKYDAVKATITAAKVQAGV